MQEEEQTTPEIKEQRQSPAGIPLSEGMKENAHNIPIELNAYHRALIYIIPDIVYFKDIHGRNMAVNKAFEDFVGLKEADIVGKTDGQISPPDLAAHCRRSDQEVIRSRKALRFVEECRLKDGTKVYFETVKSPLYDEQGDVIGLVGVSRDVTQQKHTEEHLRLFKVLINQASDAIFITSPDTGRFLEVNDTACMSLGYSRDELLNRGITDIEALFQDYSSLQIHIREVRRRGHMILDGWHKRKDGTAFPVEVNVSYVTLDKNDYLVAVVRDITAKKKFTQELVNSLPGIFGIIDQEGRILEWNKKVEEILGYSAEEISKIRALDLVAMDHREIASKKIQEGFISGEVTSEVDLISKDKKRTPYFLSGRRGYKDNKACLISMGIDISRQREMEAEIIKAQKLESIGVLAGGIAHDFNNIMTSILGNIFLSKGSLNPESDAYKNLQEAEKATLMAKDLTKQLLTFSRGGAPVRRTLSLARVIKEAVDFALRGSNVRCKYSIPKDLKPVEADEGQISQVIHNLVINAVQAMPEGGTINVRCENVAGDTKSPFPLKEKAYIKISIVDRGIGIPEEHLQKIFDPYFTTKENGTGLGLSTAYSIVKRHDGLITAESEFGAGATFHIYLLASEKGMASKREEEKTPVFGRGKILLMDDEEMVRRVAGEMLGYIGYEVEFAADGREAIELYKKASDAGQSFDLLIMDLTIPGGMNGRDAIRELLEADPHVKAIVSSGYSNDPVMSDYEIYGFKGVVTKPYKITELSNVIYDVITGKRR